MDPFTVALVAGAILGGAQAAISGGNVWQGALMGMASGAIGFGCGTLGGMLGGTIGTIAGAAGGGALSSMISGGDPLTGALSAGIGVGIGLRLGLGNPSMFTATKEWFKQLAISTGVSAVVGGTMTEIQGGDFWTGAASGAAWGAAGYVLSSILNLDDGQLPEDTVWGKVKYYAKGVARGAWGGTKNIGKTATRHAIGAVNAAGWVVEKGVQGMTGGLADIEVPDVGVPEWADSSRFVRKYNAYGLYSGSISQGAAHTGIIALETAAVCKVTGFNPKFGGPRSGKIPGSDTIHTDHPHGPYKDGHRHWLERHVNPKDPTKQRIVRRTGPK